MYNEKMQRAEFATQERSITKSPLTPLRPLMPLTPPSGNIAFLQLSPSSSIDDNSSNWWTTIKDENGSPSGSWSSDCDSLSVISRADVESPSSTSAVGGGDAKKLAGGKKKGSSAPAGAKDSAINKPAQVVARRNARERRRVQQVNSAYQKLRKKIPIDDNKSKRMSKVKTLQMAIEYINQLQDVLEYTSSNSGVSESDSDFADLFTDLQHSQEQQQHSLSQHSPPTVKMDLEEYSFRVPTSFYTHLINNAAAMDAN